MTKRELIGNTFVVTHTVEPDFVGLRADLFLKRYYKSMSRNRLQKFIDEGRVELKSVHQQKKLKPSTMLLPGDQVLVYTPRTKSEPVVDFNYKILYEDESILAIDKPANLPVHPAGKFFFNTLLMALRSDRPTWKGNGRDFYLTHRIDRETSGAILIAKTFEAAGFLVQQFRTRKVQKHYYAVIEGICSQDSFTVDCEMGSDLKSEIRLKMAAFPKGSGKLDSLTEFSVLKRNSKAGLSGRTLVNCKPLTGRQHQIRVHLASVGHPICGDKLYADEANFLEYLKRVELGKKQGERQALHSRSIEFTHPDTLKRMVIESSLPEDLASLLL